MPLKVDHSSDVAWPKVVHVLAIRKLLQNVVDHLCVFCLLYIVVDDVVNLEQFLGFVTQFLTFFVNWEFFLEQLVVNVTIFHELSDCLFISNRVGLIIVVQIIVFI
jgi:hypothetical protein